MQKWNPDVASRFTLRSAETILSTPFRLVYPNADLVAFEETGLYARQFLAISYCWRSPDFLPRGYERHGVWPVRKSIVDAILAEKNHPRLGIWMDQMCIEQSSILDKQLSVAAMDIIYRSCLRLIILLEDVVLSAPEIALLTKYTIRTRPYNKGWILLPSEIPAFTTLHAKINAARWWTRAWCFHEFSVHQPWSDKRQMELIRNATFIMCGPTEDETVKVQWVNLSLLMGCAQYNLAAASSPSALTTGQAIYSGIVKAEEQDAGWRGSIMSRWNGVSRMGVSVLEDRVSIMLNLCDLGLAYVGPPVKTEDEGLWLSCVVAMAAGETYPLSMMSNASMVLRGRPTWLCKHEVCDTTVPPFKIGTLGGIYRVEEGEIELDMVFLDAPWQSVKEKHLAPTYDIFPEPIQTTEPDTHLPEARRGILAIYEDSPTEHDIPRRRFLAGCILSGDMFTGRLWQQIKRDVVGPNYNVGFFKPLVPNPDFRGPAKILLAKLLPVSNLLGIGQAQPSEATIDDAALFLTWITDPRSMYYIGLYTFRVPSTRYWDTSFITSLTVNEKFKEGLDKDLRTAVPVDLLGTSCIPLRAWFLRPVDEEELGRKGEKKEEEKREKWRVVGKGMLLGEPDLLGEARESEGMRGAKMLLKKRTIVSG
ncbi:hypothetical protein T440DRAFT_182885 [Plenodomus tracheiphilus IPT5]|uniref:Heterokaryon incompatibility domain-containing protein n=1 Tax=Plenodomus tracheiphilus IPT5 TaxID=1408161 RepID=A0A6A7B094_9PLEO|nr:hypothetical protein T440DRAFT_182885 [Plenodomus tracheiphilus IPT5]